MKIGPIEVPAAGQRSTGTFTFAGDEGLEKYQWPYIAIAGLMAGPTVLITAGIHAAEYTASRRPSGLDGRSRPTPCAERS